MHLLDPVRIGPITVKNRLVSTAHAAFLDFYQPGCDGDRYIAYQERRAQGGTGLIILTAMHVHRSSQKAGHFIYDAADMVPKYRRMADALHRHGATVVQQIFHFDAVGKSDARDDLTPLWSLSGSVSRDGEASHAMTPEEIEEVIQGFADAARTAVEGGLDGVELHATHGYLLIQSLSPWGNRRNDAWGEPYRLITAVAQRVRAAIGPDRILGLRLSADDFLPTEAGGVGHERLCEIAAHLADLGYFDYLNHSEGCGGADYARAVGSYRHRFGEFLPLARNLREAIAHRIPVIGVGKIPTVDLAEQALAAGDCDLVGMTRAQIADPDIVRKCLAGEAQRIRPCTGSNQGCIDRQAGPYPITCFHNPDVGRERIATINVIERREAMLVVGGGPAGMKAAEIAARRGFEVTLVDSAHRLGGRLNMVENLGDAANLLSSVAWLAQELPRHGVEILLQTTVDEGFLEHSRARCVILASGATPRKDIDAPSDGSVPVVSVDDATRGEYAGMKFDMQGTRALLLDLRGNIETGLVAECLAKRGSQVTIVTPFMNYGPGIGFTHMVDLMPVLLGSGCTFRTATRLLAIREGKVTIRNAFTGAECSEAFDFVVAGTHPQPNLDLYEALSRRCRVIMAGDVVAPRSAMEAYREGDRAARTF